MNKLFIFILTLLLFLLASQVNGQNYQSSENPAIQFLRDMGEADSLIDTIKKYDSDLEYEWVYEVYVRMNGHFYYEDTVLSISFSPFKMNLNYMCNRIVQDTILDFLRTMDRALTIKPEIDDSIHIRSEIEDSLHIYSRYAMERYNSLSGLFIYNWICISAYNKDTSSTLHKCEFLYSIMAVYVLSAYCDHFEYRKCYCKGCEDCENNGKPCFPFNTGWWQIDDEWMKYKRTNRNGREYGINNPYNKYLSAVIDKIYSYDRRLYIFSQKEKEMILQILNEGISQGSRECAYTKAFAQITGLVLDKDIASGKKLLIELMPSMSDSPFWEYVEKDANNQRVYCASDGL